MKMLDHWHPVLASAQLKDRPVEVQLAGKKIVLFRQPGQGLGALDIRCPHRGMNLSFGKTEQAGLACLYHGWTFDTQGQGISPCNPKLKAQAQAYATREYADFIWISRNQGAFFPEFLLPGFQKAGVHLRQIQAPLQPVMDNFLEVEHFPTAHAWLGYGFKQINEAELVIEKDPDTVKMGFYPIEPLYPLVRKIFHLPVGSRYFMDITAYRSPVYTLHHQGWLNPANGEKKTLLINVVFYVPLSQTETQLVMFILTEPGGLFSFLKEAFVLKKTGQLVDDDLVILNHLADKTAQVSQMRLGAHDKALIEVRKRLPESYSDYASNDSEAT